MTTLSEFLQSKYDGVFYVGHASVIVRLSKKNYLFDYIENSKPYGDSWVFFPPLISDININSIDGVFVSHLHQDHMDLNFLREAQEHCPIYIIDGRPGFNKILDNAGIKYNSIEPNKKIILESDVYVYGVLHETNGVDSSLALSNESFSVYHGNDNYCSLKTLEAIRGVFGHIDVACIPYAYINWYPQLLDGVTEGFRESESNRLITQYFELALAHARELNAQQIIPFGANLVYCDTAYSAANLECRTPLEFESYIRTTYGEDLAQKFKALFSGDLIVRDGSGRLRIEQNKIYDPKIYRDDIELYLKKLDYKKPPDLDEQIHINEDRLNALNSRVSRDLKNRVDHQILVTSPSLKPHAICIDLKSASVLVADFEGDSDIHGEKHILITSDSLLNKWINSEIRLEEVIGSRNFTLQRIPNVYRSDILRIISTTL
jgi:L-ascorbate metabolism protein UlaG (beta-lactamase superfamily)